MFDKVCEELDVPFKRRGQYACFKQPYLLPLLAAYSWQKKHICGVKDTRIIGGKELRKREPELNDQFVFALYNSSAGCVCPYGLTIAYAENAVQNGAKVSLNTAVMGMEIKDNQIISVKTNKGVLYPKLVINAARTGFIPFIQEKEPILLWIRKPHIWFAPLHQLKQLPLRNSIQKEAVS